MNPPPPANPRAPTPAVDELHMRRALELAAHARDADGEVPVGAVLVVTADVGARVAFGTEIPVGIVTAIIGAPYLIWLITRHNRKERR